jgi:hypothetical protein
LICHFEGVIALSDFLGQGEGDISDFLGQGEGDMSDFLGQREGDMFFIKNNLLLYF